MRADPAGATSRVLVEHIRPRGRQTCASSQRSAAPRSTMRFALQPARMPPLTVAAVAMLSTWAPEGM
eukprot:4663015-Prymnesium_polylepis.1